MCLFQTWVSSLPRALHIQASTSVPTGVAHGMARWRVLRALAPCPLLLSLPFLLGKPTPIYPGLKARTFASAPPAHMACTQPLTQVLPSCIPAGGDLSQRPSLDHNRNTEQI